MAAAIPLILTPVGATASIVGGSAVGIPNATGLTTEIPAYTAIAGTTATITVTPSFGGCTGTAITFTVTVPAAPTVAAIADITICAG